MNSEDVVHCSHATWIVKNAEDERKEKGKRKSIGWRCKRQRLVVSNYPLFICNVNSGGECRKRRRRRRGKAMVGGENDGGRWWTALHCSLAEQWWRMQKMKEKERERGRGKAVAGGGNDRGRWWKGAALHWCTTILLFSSVFALLLLSIYKNKTDENIAKKSWNSFSEIEFWTHIMVGPMHKNCVLFCNQTR